MIAIVAVNENWGIGFDGKLLYTIPEDQRFFRDSSLNKAVVMGKNTFLSLPGGKPLKNRINIVLTRDKGFAAEGITVCHYIEELTNVQTGVAVCHSVEELLNTVKAFPPDDVIVMGGQEIYALLLPYCSAAYVTKVKDDKPADTFFPDIDRPPNWKIESCSEEKGNQGIRYVFYKYVNNSQWNYNNQLDTAR